MHTPHTLIAIASASALLTGVAAAQPAAAQPERALLEEVVVTAQKRAETLAEIPMSVTVLTGDSLERQQAHNFQDLVARVPGFSLTSNRQGVTRVTLRGVNTGGVASTVGVYVDDVPFGSSTGLANAAILSGDIDTFDLDRLEVLRGPQGTLYGASALGGVMKYVSNTASTDAFEARAKVGFESVRGGEAGYAVTGLVNVPVSDRVAVRASGFYRQDGGYVRSIGNNPIASLTDPGVNVVSGTRVESDINDVDVFGGRVSALFHVADNVTLDLRVMAQNIETGSTNLIDADPVTLQPSVSGAVRSRYHRDPSDIEYRVYSAALDWDLRGMTLQSVTSYSTFEQDFVTDVAANTALAGVPLAPVTTLIFGDPVTRPLSAIQTQITSTDKFTQELRLVSTDDSPFKWLVGVYYTKEDSAIDPQRILAVEAGTDTVAADIPVLAEAKLDSDFEEIALFANATWEITDRLELSFGARVSRNEQSASQTLEGALLGGAVSFDDADSSEKPFTYSISPRFQLTDNVAVYGRVATGYRPGGPNVIPAGAPPGTPGSYDSDELTSYEVGVKASSVDGRFAIDLAAFYLDWEDVQLLAVVNGVGLNANGGTAVSRGAEFAATFRPMEELTFSLNGAYTDAELTEDTDPIVGGSDGDPLSYVPKWSFAADAELRWPIGAALAYAGVNLSYVDDRPAGFNNRDPDGRIRRLDSYTTLGLRAGVEFDRWTVEVYGKNVTDDDGLTDIVNAGVLPNGQVGLSRIRPRTFGLTVGAHW
jgi:iron complex outermembrane recepter protein